MMTPKNTTAPTAPVNDVATLASLGVSFDGGGGDYFFSKEEKDDIIDADPAINFDILAIDFEPKAKFGERWVLTVRPSGLEEMPERGWAFAATGGENATKGAEKAAQRRSAIFEQLATMMERNGGKPVGPINFVQIGQWRTIRDASGETVAVQDQLDF